MKKQFISLFSLILFPFCLFADEVTVYSSRIESLIKPLFNSFTKDTGIEVKFITDKEGPLMERIKQEGKNTQADVFLAVDAGNLWQATQMGLLQSIESPILEQNIPAHLRDPDNHWFGLTVRARTIFYNKQNVNPNELSTYEALADPKWKGKLCLRSSKKVYNQSLVAMMIVNDGEKSVEKTLKGWVNNLAAPVFPDDTQVLKAIASGQCDVGIANTYYYGSLISQEPQLPVGLFWANQDSTGVHVNISGAAVTRYAKHKKNAITLLDWLSSEKAQKILAGLNYEYPANPSVKPIPLVASWGSFKQNPLNVANAGKLQAKAVKLMDRVGYN